jgi:hypothetical protein
LQKATRTPFVGIAKGAKPSFVAPDMRQSSYS